MTPRSLLLASSLLPIACTHPTADPEPARQPEPPAKQPTASKSGKNSGDPIRRLVLGNSGIATMTASGKLNYDYALPDRWLATQGAIADIWIGDGLCIRNASGVACKTGSSNPFVGVVDEDKTIHLGLPTDAEVIDLDWSYRSVCAVTSDGATWCSFTEAGEDNRPMRRFPVSGALDVEINQDFGCARLEDRSAVCWLGNQARLGEFCKATPDAPGCQDLGAEHVDWPAPSERFTNTRDIAVGFQYMCILDEEGTPQCHDSGWGGMSRLGKKDGFMPIHDMPPLVEIDGGSDHLCGRTRDGEVWCWGDNTGGQLGDGTTQSQPMATPIRVDGFGSAHPASLLALDGSKSCALADGQVECWGLFISSRLDPIPNEVSGVIATELDVAATTTCAKVSKGWKCWGGSIFTLAGAAEASRIVDAVPSEEFGEGCKLDGSTLRCADEELTWLSVRGVVDVVRSSDPLCVLRKNKVECHESYFSEGEPPIVIPVPASTAIQGTVEDGCVLTKAGEMHCWTEGEPAKRLDLPGTQVQIAMSYWDACALDDAGVVRCRYLAGEPPVVAGVTDVVELRASGEHMCARTRAGKLACWGGDLLPVSYEIEEPSFEQPLWLDLPAPVVEFGLGEESGCARLDDGRVFCWGAEWQGQRGRLSSQYLIRPTVMTIPPVVASAPAESTEAK